MATAVLRLRRLLRPSFEDSFFSHVITPTPHICEKARAQGQRGSTFLRAPSDRVQLLLLEQALVVSVSNAEPERGLRLCDPA